MDILIVGSGISGIMAAIVLRGQGHRVTIFEQSRLNQETGAAIMLPPNSNALLRKFGFSPEDYGANLNTELRLHTIDGKLELSERFSTHDYQYPWQMIHRQELHRGLKELAQDPLKPGIPVDIKVSSRVISVAADTATIYFEGGSNVSGDIILGADGIHSATRKAVQERFSTNYQPFSTGTSAFRFLIPREALVNDSITRAAFQDKNVVFIWHADQRKVVCYPCDDNVTMNFVAIHPSTRVDTEGWDSKGSKETLISIFQNFPSEVIGAFKHVHPDKIRLYPLMDMQHLPGWTNGRLALIGDAAHPFLPHLAQGGAQAIEDAVSIGVFLSADTKVSEIPRRLQLYESARMNRAHKIQHASRFSSEDNLSDDQAKEARASSREYQFRHDEFAHSQRLLQAHMHELVT